MNKKSVFSILLIGAFLLLLTGCEDFSKKSNPVTNNSNTNSTVTNNSNYIGTDKAKEIGLSDAGIDESQALELSVELDNDSSYGKVIYEVDFKYNGKEYEYDIDALDGKILNKKEELDD